MLKSISRFFAAINGYQRPGELAAGAACGVILGVLPGGNASWWILFIVFALVKINKGAMILVMLLFMWLASSLDPLLHSLGYGILTAPALNPLFTRMASLPLVPLTRFNNTLVMGGLAAALPLWLISYAVFRLLVKFYRSYIRDTIIRPRLLPWIKRVPILRHMYRALEILFGAGEGVWRS
ncbi:TIGR03546 family protein [Salinispira pacifica]|uniref:DUF2062 domain-containing protein n=1 Tax=Salinispira pacifica TaxID=1307761 RepID=V5WEW4_9SPIO|nr:TIGR03546 family protein [Salinispira pacifica]AHC14358.1 putative protein-transmembrane prediction [Salinispira pacifica]